MAECEAPSFSLGLDLALDTPPHSPLHPPPPAAPNEDEEPQPSCFDADDDIEEFSSQEDPVQVHAPPSARNHSVCSSSKVSLNGCGVLTPHSSSNCGERKGKQNSDIPASVKLETGQSGLVFPKLTASPLRRFQLLDSDSDSDDPVDEDVFGANKVHACSKEATCNQSKPSTSLEQNRKTSVNANQNEDLWKDFSPVKSFSIPTPAFNEIYEEYFHSTKRKEAEKSNIDISASHNERHLGVSSSCQKDQQLWESADPVPPAHHYFFHEDPRIRQLIRSRLCNFSPLGINKVNQQPNVSHIDYMGQFNNEGASKTQGVEKGYVNNSTSRKRKSKKLIDEETFNASEGWVDPKIISPSRGGETSRKKATKRNSSKNSVSKRKNETNKSSISNVSCASADWVEPKSCSSMPKDAGKRRVQASGQSAGHWYTSSDGRKVYVNKSGQELTGQVAYRQYRKENGAGFRKSKKKTGAKKTNAKKRN
ncbi:hypothetical protein SESBI_38191 [Sesbania bispinosa]|nr:hypothetical protein SESBI_38191 [Sesbania bispinosa]